MSRLWCALSQMLRRCRAPAAPQRLLHWCSSASRVTPALLRRPASTMARQFGRQYRWYDDPRKVAAAMAIGLSAAMMATCDREVVPCTNRSHLVVLSPKEERDLGESLFAEEMAKHRHKTVDPCHPDSVRVRRIAERIIHAANRGLGVYNSRDAPMLRVTQKGNKPWAPQPHTRHLHGLNGSWELVLATHGNATAGSAPGGKIIVFTGLLDWYKTDGEIAFALAHEVGHLIARHQADIMSRLWLPAILRRRFLHRKEIEADHIGTLLLGAAGFHPLNALAFIGKATEIVGDYTLRREILEADHPHPKRRLWHLSNANTMEEALELYREATAMDKVTKKYFVNPTM
uniref:Peptidase M48 domain-containing protein n=1 Tax=Triticum urartu TaxID=4572 RepID=A0A8R7UDL0_TRIUA